MRRRGTETAFENVLWQKQLLVEGVMEVREATPIILAGLAGLARLLVVRAESGPL